MMSGCVLSCRVGSADGGGDEGVESHRSSGSYCALELPSHVAHMEGKDTSHVLARQS